MGSTQMSMPYILMYLLLTISSTK